MLYSHCITPATWTLPSHAALFTGLLWLLIAHQHEVALDEGRQLVGRRDLGDARRKMGVDALHPGLEQRDEQVVLALEVQVDGPVRDAGLARDLGDPGREEAMAGEDLLGRDQDPLALVGAGATVARDGLVRLVLRARR